MVLQCGSAAARRCGCPFPTSSQCSCPVALMCVRDHVVVYDSSSLCSLSRCPDLFFILSFSFFPCVTLRSQCMPSLSRLPFGLLCALVACALVTVWRSSGKRCSARRCGDCGSGWQWQQRQRQAAAAAAAAVILGSCVHPEPHPMGPCGSAHGPPSGPSVDAFATHTAAAPCVNTSAVTSLTPSRLPSSTAVTRAACCQSPPPPARL